MKRIAKEHFANYRFLSNLQFSCAGKISFVKTSIDLENNKYLSDVYILRKDFSLQRITYFENIKKYKWLDDENILILAATEEKDKKCINEGIPLTVAYLVSVAGGEKKELLRVNKRIEQIEAIGEKGYLLLGEYNLMEEKLLADTGGDWDQFVKAKKADEDYTILNEIPCYQEGTGYTSEIRNMIYLYKDGILKSITDFSINVESLKVYGEKYAVFTAKDISSRPTAENKLFYLDLESLQVREISVRSNYIHRSILPIDDDKVLIVGNDMKRRGLYQNEGMIILSLSNGEAGALYDKGEYHFYNSVNTDIKYNVSGEINFAVDEEGVYFVATSGDSSHIMHMNFKSLEVRQITKQKGAIMDFIVQGHDVYAIAMRGLDGPEIYFMRDTEIKMTDFNSCLSTEYTLCKPCEMTYKNKDSIEITGWIIKPSDFSPEEKVPAILFIHGGPNTVYGDVLIHEMQYFANNGYGVMYCNPRGSEGKGNEFADLRNKYGTIDYEDIMSFVEEAVRNNTWIDKERLGVTGGSYGGFMTNWIIGKTDMFKAAVSERSSSDWITAFFTSDIGCTDTVDAIGATPWENYEELLCHSPIKYADKAKTPTLFIHSENDYRCRLVEAQEMFTALKYFGVESRLFIFKDENHSLSRSGKPNHRIKRLDIMKEWFDRFLMPGAAK